MTASEIAQRLTSGEQTPARLTKAKLLAQRSQVAWADVEAALMQPMPKVRAQRVSFRPRERRAR